MSNDSECEPARFYVRYAGAGRGPSCRWRSARLTLAAAALILAGSAAPALASHGTQAARPSGGSARFAPCRHGGTMRDYLRPRVVACSDSPTQTVAATEPRMSDCPEGMTHKDGTGFIVWACKDAAAGPALRAADKIVASVWKAMTKLMGGPLPDVGGVAGGGPGIKPADGRSKWIDIYLLYPTQVLHREDEPSALGGATAVTVPDNLQTHPNGSQTGSGYILLGRSRMSSPGFKSDFVHEFFHVLQNRWNYAACGARRNWFKEASATWAETYFARDTAAAEVYKPWFIDGFEKNPGTSLMSVTGVGDPYDAFIWPFFMQQHGGGAGIISRAWRAMAGKATCATMNQAISSQLPFSKYFGKFAVENFDKELPNIGDGTPQWPVGFKSMYRQVDKNFPEVLPKESMTTPPLDVTTSRAVKVADLATQYDRWQTGLRNDGLSIEFNFSGITNRQNLAITAIVAEANQFSVSRPFLVIPVRSNYLRICAPADSPSHEITQGIDIHLILANHSMASSGSVGGSYTVTPRTVCAASAMGSYSETYSSVDKLGGTYNETVTLTNVHFVPSLTFSGWEFDPTKGTYTYTSTLGSGSGPLSQVSVGGPGLGAWDLGAYSYQPGLGIFGTDFVPSPGTDLPVSGGNCPLSNVVSVHNGTFGKYVNNFQAIDLTCSDSGPIDGNLENAQISTSGSIQAQDPILCGIWTCDVTKPPPATTSASNDPIWPHAR